METLARVYGRDKLRLALRSYVDRFRHEHPVPDDLYQELARHLGIAESLLHQMFDVPSHLDVAIDQVRSSGNGPYQSQVLLRRRGDLALPYEVQVTFKGGASRQFQVPGEDKTHTLSFTHADPVLLVQADPEHKLLLDENLLNNRYAAPNRPPRVQAAARLSSFFGALLFGLGP